MDNPEGSPPRTERYRSTVLVVDDEPVNRMVLEGVLPDHVRVITADSGISALKAAAGEPSRVLIYPGAKDGKGFGLVIIPFKLANQ